MKLLPVLYSRDVVREQIGEHLIGSFEAEMAVTVHCIRCGATVSIPNEGLAPLRWCREHAAAGCPVIREDRFMAAVDRLTDALTKKEGT